MNFGATSSPNRTAGIVIGLVVLFVVLALILAAVAHRCSSCSKMDAKNRSSRKRSRRAPKVRTRRMSSHMNVQRALESQRRRQHRPRHSRKRPDRERCRIGYDEKCDEFDLAALIAESILRESHNDTAEKKKGTVEQIFQPTVSKEGRLSNGMMISKNESADVNREAVAKTIQKTFVIPTPSLNPIRLNQTDGAAIRAKLAEYTLSAPFRGPRSEVSDPISPTRQVRPWLNFNRGNGQEPVPVSPIVPSEVKLRPPALRFIPTTIMESGAGSCGNTSVGQPSQPDAIPSSNEIPQQRPFSDSSAVGVEAVASDVIAAPRPCHRLDRRDRYVGIDGPAPRHVRYLDHS